MVVDSATHTQKDGVEGNGGSLEEIYSLNNVGSSHSLPALFFPTTC
jgi:hypothetical protein